MALADALLADGEVVTVRSLRPEDRPELLDLYNRCSSDALRMRFFSYARHLAERDIDRMLRPGAGATHSSLAALVRGRMLGVGSIERTSATRAEFALLVDDQHHGLGVGTLLLEHLVSAARRLGIETLSADIMMENRAMLGVLRNLGAQVGQSVETGVVTVEFPTAAGDRWYEAVHQREARAEQASIGRLLAPHSITVVGASASRENIGRRIVENIVAGGYAGAISVVNRTGRGIAGAPGFIRLADVDPPPQVVVLAVPSDDVITVAEQAAAVGVWGLVVISSGFAEAGDPAGQARQRDLLRIARDAGIRVVGPNSVGIIDMAAEVRLNATPSDFAPRPGSVGLISQSGGVGIALTAHLSAHGVGVSSFVSAGNKIDVSGNDLLMYWQGDPATEVCAMYIESFGNPRKFARIARIVGRTKPIVVVTGGRASATARAGDAGTSADVASDAALDALFNECGVIRAHGIGALTDILLLLSRARCPTGWRVAVVANRRGPAAVAADACVAAGLSIPDLAAGTRDRLIAHQAVGASLGSPARAVLMTSPELIPNAAQEVLGSDAADAALVCVAGLTPSEEEELRAPLEKVALAADRPVAVVLLGSPGAPLLATDSRLPVYDLPERAAAALAAAASYQQWCAHQAEPPELTPADVDLAQARRLVTSFSDRQPAGGRLDAEETALLLGSFGVTVTSPSRQPDQPEPTSVELQVEIANDGPVGPVVAIANTDRRLPKSARVRAVHLAPLDAADAASVAKRFLPDAGRDGGDGVMARALSDLLMRIGRLADALPEVGRLRIDALRIAPDGSLSADTEVVMTPNPSRDIYLRQLAPTS